MRVLRVTGRGELHLRPDVTKVRLVLNGREWEYEDLLARAAKDTAALKEELGRLGFAAKDVRTTDFQASAEYESVYNKETGEHERRFSGYEYVHELKIEFPSDNGRLGKILYAMAHSAVAPEISFRYSILDKEAARNELLAKAVSDARAKARILAAAAGEQLGAIQSIDYSWGRIRWDISPISEMVCSEADVVGNSYNIEIEPDDVRLEDTVTVVWELA